MSKKFHYICGLPRAGSTLLTAILNQNPRFYSEITNPLFEIYHNTYNVICSSVNNNTNANEIKKSKVLTGIIENYYSDVNKEVIFNTNRQWCSLVRLISQLQPESKFIFCVRDAVSILNSFEHYFTNNPLYIPSLYISREENNLLMSSFSRADHIYSKMIYPSIVLIEEAICSGFKDKICIIEYDHLCSNPNRIIKELYDFLGEPHYEHNYEDVSSSHEKYDLDANSNSPNLHSTRKLLKAIKRDIILPREIVEKYSNKEIWRKSTVLENV